ncbi:hypothetical protein NDU88_003052 [Pleurodeles waltl]|uniref:Uncharacterized protein n=1 Tax=Pleurodeles waltl TaxID=8319 RepID=A0AAV7M2C8_PLEWA|nr:hypothetical protein NDU88_003052 [Pleurodeles waltl]
MLEAVTLDEVSEQNSLEEQLNVRRGEAWKCPKRARLTKRVRTEQLSAQSPVPGDKQNRRKGKNRRRSKKITGDNGEQDSDE